MQVEASRVSTITDPSTNVTFTTILYRRGKTTRRRDPFVIHIPQTNPLAHELAAFAETRMTTETQPTYLFTPPAGRAAALKKIAEALKTVSSELGLLSIRRGGLQQMALQGLSLQTILAHSRHTTEQLLNRYLGWGAFNFAAARELAQTRKELQHGDDGRNTPSPRRRRRPQ